MSLYDGVERLHARQILCLSLQAMMDVIRHLLLVFDELVGVVNVRW